jgi:hypothetical protein
VLERIVRLSTAPWILGLVTLPLAILGYVVFAGSTDFLLRVRSVLCLCGGREAAEEEQVCAAMHVDFRLDELDPDRLPKKEELLVRALDACRQPMLLQDHWGMERTSLAAAIAQAFLAYDGAVTRSSATTHNPTAATTAIAKPRCTLVRRA